MELEPVPRIPHRVGGDTSLRRPGLGTGTARTNTWTSTTSKSDPPPALLMSIKPRYANAILDGDKTVELRRKAPTQAPPTVVIYGSGSARQVLGMARLTGVHTATPNEIWMRFGSRADVTRAEFDLYFSGSQQASALELSDPHRAATQVNLDDLRRLGVRPPQSWCYLRSEALEALLEALIAVPAVPTTRDACVLDCVPEIPGEDTLLRVGSGIFPRALRLALSPALNAAEFAAPYLATRLQRAVRLG